MKKLYTVDIEIETVVVADSQEEAEALAMEALQDIDTLGYWTEALPLRVLPDGWDGTSIPFGHHEKEDPDRTVDQWAEAGAAPEYLEFQEKLAKTRTRSLKSKSK